MRPRTLRTPIVALTLALAASLALLPAPAASEDAQAGVRPQYPLGSSKLSIAGSRRLTFQARWTGSLGAMNPVFDGSTLRIAAGPNEGDTGLIRLKDSRWKKLKGDRGFVYSDAKGSAGGIRSVAIRTTKKGGRIKIRGARVGFTANGSVTTLTVTLTIGPARWCAVFDQATIKKGRVQASAADAPASCPCETFESTWEAIQTVVFARHGCLQAACHGRSPGQGNLDLRPEVAYENLVGVFSPLGQQLRVERGSRQDSFLWRKLAAATEGLPGVPGTPMPQGLTAISADELEALRLWIQYGAPETGVIEGTEARLDSCLPPAAPPRIQPAAPPPAGQGVQFYAPPWTIPAKDEDEVCYATYHNVEAQIPPEFKVPCPDYWGGPTKACFFFNKSELTQEPNSHHSIIHIYRGAFPAGYFCTAGPNASQPCNPANPGVPAPDGDVCGGDGQCVSGFDFRCGGAKDGAPCDPRVPDVCGSGTRCSGVVKSSLACIGYGPPDYQRGFSVSGVGSDNAPSVGGSQQPFVRNVNPAGVFGVFPAEAVWVWNSHAFNLFDVPTTNEQWLNVYFAGAADRLYPIQGIFDAADIFVQSVPPFEEREYCRTITMRQGTRLYELSSHTHKRGRLFRVWGPGIAQSCRSTTENPEACTPEAGKPVLVTTQYNDPAQVKFDPPLALDSPDPAARRLKFCAIYDNGKSIPADVKRNSTSPAPPQFGVLAPGGPCKTGGLFKRDLGITCLDGPKKGQLCAGDDRASDSAPGANDGRCDACPLFGGVTTEDEMFILLGSYFCQPGTPCEDGPYGL
jgi:hypothetical protein